MSVLVSIIVPSFNSCRFIQDSIKSVVAQTYENWELLIVDGGSVDGTVELVEAIAQEDARVRLIKNDNDTGPAQARAFGISHCHGDYIAFLDSDDLWSTIKLERQLEFMLAHNYQFTFTDYRLISEENKVSHAVMGGWRENSYWQYLGRRGIANSSVILARECISEKVMAAIWGRLAEDSLWWLLIMRTGYKAYALKEPLLLYRRVSTSRSTQTWQNSLAVWDIYTKELGNGKLTATTFYLLYVIDVCVRRLRFMFAEKVRK
jgi:teichuronic acid biosynthesis glycosyltransferase TuaG